MFSHRHKFIVPRINPQDFDDEAVNWRRLQWFTDDVVAEYRKYPVQWLGASANPTLGNGVLEGWVRDLGPNAEIYIHLLIGSTTVLATGFWSFTLPYTSRFAWSLPGQIMSATPSNRQPVAGYLAADGNTVSRVNFAGGSISAVAPYALATGDELILAGHYVPIVTGS